MFQDEKEELARIQQALMETEPDEEWEESQEDWEEYDDPGYDDCVYNADRCDEDLEDYTRQVLEEKDRGVSGLTITALLLACGVLGVILWILLRHWI